MTSGWVGGDHFPLGSGSMGGRLMRRSTVKELHRSGERITHRSRASYAFTTLSEGSPF